MKFVVETSLIVKRHKRTGQAIRWKKVKRIVAASSHDEAGELDDELNLIEHGTNDYGCRTTWPVAENLVEMRQLEFEYGEV